MCRRYLLMLTLIFTLITGVACSGSNEGEAGTKDPVSSEENEQKAAEDVAMDTDVNEESDEEINLNNKEDSDSDRDSEDLVQEGLPKPIVLNEQIQHPKGVIFVLEKITFKEDHIQVDFNAENHTGYSQVLASQGEAKGSNLGGITLEDDTGFVYRYIAKDNPRIKLDDREKVTGTVSFTGSIQDDAKSITLIFNPGREFEFVFENLELVR